LASATASVWIYAIEFVPESRTYLVIAGAFDDAHDFRPGRRAAKELAVRSPLD